MWRNREVSRARKGDGRWGDGPFTLHALVALMRASTRSAQDFLSERANQLGLDASAFVRWSGFPIRRV
jgi:hypothetical protein